MDLIFCFGDSQFYEKLQEEKDKLNVQWFMWEYGQNK